MGRVSIGISAIALAIMLAGPAQADNYLRGSQLAELYGKYVFCYNHATYGYNETCTAIEEIDSVTPSILRITHRELIRFRERTPNSWGDVLDTVLLSKTFLHPEGWEKIDVQTQTIIPNGLCRDKQTRVQDDSMMGGVMIADLSKPWADRSAASPDNLERWRDGDVQDDQNSIANVECSRYTVFQTQNSFFGPTTYLLGEDLYYDEVLQPGRGGVIKLYPKGTSLVLRVP